MLGSNTASTSPRDLLSYQAAALSQLPLAVLLFSLDEGVVFANNACQNLFGVERVGVGSAVLDLPIIWPTTSHDAIKKFLSGRSISRNDETKNFLDTDLRCSIRVTAATATETTANVRVTTLEGLGHNVYMLSFEDVKLSDSHKPTLADNMYTDGEKSHSNGTPDARAKSSNHPVRRKASDPSLEKHLARLREAIYFSSDDSGFMIDVDETVVYPNWNAASDVKPVRLKNGAADFVDWYDIWDIEFREKLPLSAYPARRLNVERKKYRGYRIGLRDNGRDLITECSGDPLFDKDTGEYIGGVVWVRTLGERNEVLLADMKASLSDYQTICERLPHILWTMTPEGHMDYFTENWYEYTGLSETESMGGGFAQAFHPEDLPRFRESTIATARDSTNKFVEARCLRYDSVWQWFAVAAKPLLDSQGELLKWYGTMTEIQALVSERQEADRKKVQMQDMLTLADVSLFQVDCCWKLTMLQGKPFWWQKQDESTCVDLKDVQSGGIPEFESHARQVKDREEKRADFEFELFDRWYKCRLITDADSDPDKDNLLGCTIDITDQRQKSLLVIENSRLIADRAVALEKNRLKDEFLAHMSHEVRTPIAGVVGMSEVLQETKLDERQSETLRDIIDSAKNLLEIVNDILDLSKIDSGKTVLERVEINVASLVEQVSRVFQHSVRHKPVELKSADDISSDLMMVGDPTKVRQIISNLLSNAIKFTPKGSVVVSVTPHPGQICFAVKDTGIGISDSTLAKLFSPFVQGDSSTARQYGGTGLGLAICRGLAEMMGGSLWIDSELGVGTTATLRLPTNLDTVPAEDQTSNANHDVQVEVRNSPENVSKPPGDDLAILVVEDNAINRKFALHLIQKHGYRGVAAVNGQEALNYLAGDPADIALILMDCHMPIMDGYETTRHIRGDEKYAAWKDVPIVALTASAVTGDREKCEAAGMHEYLTKPVSYEHFDRVIGKWLPARPKLESEGISIVK